MADYFQNGVITTLHNLSDRPVDELENDLLGFTKQGSPMALILPSLYSELEGPALKKIVNQLKEVKYVKQIIIGLDRANNEEQFRHAKEFFSVLPQDVNILWNDGPKMKEIQKLLSAENLAPTEPMIEACSRDCFILLLTPYLVSNLQRVFTIELQILN